MDVKARRTEVANLPVYVSSFYVDPLFEVYGDPNHRVQDSSIVRFTVQRQKQDKDIHLLFILEHEVFRRHFML